jgi:choline/carnitine/betaine transport
LEFHPVVFGVSAGLLLTFVVVCVVIPDRARLWFHWLLEGISTYFSWLYVGAMTGFLIFILWLSFSRFGTLRLGDDASRPEFSTPTWFAMLFSAGMGIGMLFFGVAEPMFHYIDPLVGCSECLDAARQSMGITLFHWCLHPWALYCLVGLALAYFSFRRGLPLSLRSAFYPLLGKRIFGPLGDGVDVLAVIATLVGLATSLGLGAKQINAGLAYVFGLPQQPMVQIGIIVVVTGMAVTSLLSGLNVGIRRLSEVNMLLAAFLLSFLFVFGPTRFLLNSLVENLGTYLQVLPENSFWTAAFAGPEKVSWFGDWTGFYWGWWIAWSPFVGMFIARISRGRTVRGFIAGVLLVPSAVAAVWMSGFGGTALHQEVHAKVESSVETGAAWNYEPRNFSVQKLDIETGLPWSEDGRWLVADGVRLRSNGGNLVTADGIAAEIRYGVLVELGSFRPVRENAWNRFSGRYQASEEELTLSGYLREPVLTRDKKARQDTISTAMFYMLEAYPIAWLTALLGTLCAVLFFVTSSDSASLVADIVASGGNQSPPKGTRLFWGLLEGLLAAILLLAGGLQALRAASVTIGLPFCILLVLVAWGLLKDLMNEKHKDLKE